MSFFVLSTRAKSSLCSALGTAKWSRHACKSAKNACHSSSVMSRCTCDSRMERPVYCCGPPVAQQTISVTRYLNPGPGDAMMRLIDLGISVQPRVIHDAVNKVINDGGNGIDA